MDLISYVELLIDTLYVVVLTMLIIGTIKQITTPFFGAFAVFIKNVICVIIVSMLILGALLNAHVVIHNIIYYNTLPN